VNKLKNVTNYLVGNRGIKYLLGILIVLVIADGVISRLVVTKSLGWEANPFLQTIVGKDAFLAIKVGGVLLCALILWDIYKHWPKLAVISSSCFVVLYSGIVFWNLYVFFFAQV
jgi:hypothetical protein